MPVCVQPPSMHTLHLMRCLRLQVVLRCDLALLAGLIGLQMLLSRQISFQQAGVPWFLLMVQHSSVSVMVLRVWQKVGALLQALCQNEAEICTDPQLPKWLSCPQLSIVLLLRPSCMPAKLQTSLVHTTS